MIIDNYVTRRFNDAQKAFDLRQETFKEDLEKAVSSGLHALELMAAVELVNEHNYKSVCDDLSQYIAAENEESDSTSVEKTELYTQMLTSMTKILAIQTQMTYDIRLRHLDLLASTVSESELNAMLSEWTRMEQLSSKVASVGFAEYYTFARECRDLCSKQLHLRFG